MPRPGPGDRGSNEEQLSTVLRPSGELSSRRSAVLPPQARFSGHHAQESHRGGLCRGSKGVVLRASFVPPQRTSRAGPGERLGDRTRATSSLR